METTQTWETTPEAVQVLVQMHQMLWEAGEEAERRMRRTRDLVMVTAASNLTYACDLVLDMIPEPERAALLDRPVITGQDPLQIARRAEELSRTVPVHEFPPGISSVVILLIDTVRDCS